MTVELLREYRGVGVLGDRGVAADVAHHHGHVERLGFTDRPALGDELIGDAGGEEPAEALALFLAFDDRPVEPTQTVECARLPARDAFGEMDEQPLHPVCDCRWCGVQGHRDRLDGAPAGDHLEQFVVIGTEAAGSPDRVDQRRHDHGVEHRATGGHLADRSGELVALGDAVLQEVGVPGGAFGEQRHRVVGVVVLAEDDDAGAGVTLADLLAGVDALGLEVRRHADVADDDVGMGLAGAGDERVVVLGDADHLDVGVALQHGAHAGTDDRAVVGEKDGDGPH